MNKGLTQRLTIDAAMIVLFVTALAFRATGGVIHEWAGAGFILLFAAHTAVNLGWYRSLFKGRHGVRRMLGAMTNMALLFSMLTVCVTGIMQSRHIFGPAHHFDGASLHALHSLASYWSMVFIGIHTGLHWDMIMGFLSKSTRGAKKAGALPMTWMAALLVIPGGVWAWFDRVMGSKLFLGYSFDFWDPSRPLALFYAANLAIIGLYAVIAYHIQKSLIKAWKNTPRTQSGRG